MTYIEYGDNNDILIAEDSPTQAEMLRFLLEKYNYQVTVATNGKEAIDILKKDYKPLLVISDIVMPIMDGYELCKSIKENNNLKDIPVILLTSLGDPKDVLKGLECGADNFITKPYDEKYLLSRVQYVLANRMLRESEKVQMGIEIFFGNNKYYITAARQQILNLLLSTYETAVQKNFELLEVRDELKTLNEQLETKVEERTSELKAEVEERKKIEKTLRESEEHYRSLFDSARDMIFTHSLNGIITSVNPAFEIITGWSSKEWLGKSFKFLIHPDDINLAKNLLGCIAEGKAPSIFELRIHTSSDEYIIMEFRAVPQIVDGNLVGGLCIARNITERKQKEEALRQSEEKYRTLIENIQDGVYIIQDSKVVFVNETFAKISGYTVDEVIGMDFKNLIAPEDLDIFVEHYSKKIAGEEVSKEYEFRILRKDETKRIVNINYGVINYCCKSSIMGTMKDITKQKEAEEKIKRVAKEWEETFNSITDLITIQDKDFNIIRANKTCADFFNVKLEDLKGVKCYKLVHCKNEPWDTCPVKKAIISKKTEVSEFFEPSIGAYLEVTASPTHNEKGENTGVVHIIKNITERKKAEVEIKESLKEKEVLLKEVHHRVKNNMQIISSLLRLQSGYIDNEKYLSMFKDSQNRIVSMALVHEKLYQSKDLHNIDFNEYIKDLVSTLFQSYNLERVTPNIVVETSELGIDFAIPCGLIINELVTNSLKYAFPKGKIGVINVILKKVDEVKNEFELIVSDNGIGIPDSVNFENTDSLGLYLVRILSEGQLQGKINLKRENGTEFKIRFKGTR